MSCGTTRRPLHAACEIDQAAFRLDRPDVTHRDGLAGEGRSGRDRCRSAPRRWSRCARFAPIRRRSLAMRVRMFASSQARNVAGRPRASNPRDTTG